MKKKIILKIIEDHPEIAVLFYELINVVNSCNKNQFMEFSRGKETNFDVALPQEWFNECQSLGIDPKDYVMDYSDGGSFGKPVNIYKEIVLKFQKEVER